MGTAAASKKRVLLKRRTLAWAGGVSLLLAAGSAFGRDASSAGGRPAGERSIAGTVIEGGVECPLFQADGGAAFTLMGVGGPQFKPGTRLRVKGHPAAASTCMQGDTLIVTSVEVLNE